MRTFKEFILIAEKYYKPTESLPSGRSPIQKHFAKAERLRRKGNIDQSNRLEDKFSKVKRGADNPELDKTTHKDLNVSHSGDQTTFHHKPSGVFYSISKDDNDTYDVSWDHSNNPTSDRERKKIISNAKKVWSQHVEPRLPHGATLSNHPIENKKDVTKNTRAKIYQKYGFSEPTKTGTQYAKVGRPPSPRQAAKGKKRLSPTSAPEYRVNNDIDYDDD